MATLAEIQTKANTKLQQLWDTHIIPKQTAYWNKHGTFFGFNWTPSADVIDGVDTDFGEIQRPSRKHVAVDVQFPLTEQVPFQVQIMRHVSDVHSFTAFVRVKLLDGRVFWRNRKATPVITPAVWNNDDPENPFEQTPAVISDWVLDTSPWEEIIDEEI